MMTGWKACPTIRMRMETWIWRHFRMDHPADWEMLQYSRQMPAGRCVFADRYQFRLEFNWKKCNVPLNFHRMLLDYQKKLEQDQKKTTVHRFMHANWHGLETKRDGVTTSRFGQFFGLEGCLIEVVLIWPGAKDESLAHKILHSVREEPAVDGLRRWRAFGMDMFAQEDLALQECRVEPARTQLIFTGANQDQEIYQRLGMVERWLSGSVAHWLRRQVPQSLVHQIESSTCRGDHQIHWIEGQMARSGISRIIRPPARYQAAACICPADGRLYGVSHAGAGIMRGDSLAGTKLSCCDDLRVVNESLIGNANGVLE